MQCPPTKPGRKGRKFHGACGLENLGGVDVHAVEDQGQLIHESDVQVALGVLDDLGRFGHLDGRCPVHAGPGHGLVEADQEVGRGFVLAGHDPDDGLQGMVWTRSPGLIRSGE